jgi:hypothetical protein
LQMSQYADNRSCRARERSPGNSEQVVQRLRPVPGRGHSRHLGEPGLAFVVGPDRFNDLVPAGR